MPLPVIIPITASVAAGIGATAKGSVKFLKSKKTLEKINEEHEANLKQCENASKLGNVAMDNLAKMELDILKSFEHFSDLIEKIQGRPEFSEYKNINIGLPKYDPIEMKEISVGANILIGTMGGATVGVIGGLAASGVTTSAVTAFGVASTGTAIKTLSGAALNKAVLAAIGGGSIASGGGGVALGALILNTATLGVGLLVGGCIFMISSDKLSKKVDVAEEEMLNAKANMKIITDYFVELKKCVTEYSDLMKLVKSEYMKRLNFLEDLILKYNKVEWSKYDSHQKQTIENTVLLVRLLNEMCKLNILDTTNVSEENPEFPTINKEGIKLISLDTNKVLTQIK